MVDRVLYARVRGHNSQCLPPSHGDGALQPRTSFITRAQLLLRHDTWDARSSRSVLPCVQACELGFTMEIKLKEHKYIKFGGKKR